MLNRIRLPLYLSKPQFPIEKRDYSKSDGTRVTLSAKVGKTYALMTDYMPEKWHERLHTALLHDTVNIEGEKYAGGVKLEKMDEIDWQNFLDYPIAPVNGVVSVDPFFAVNSNCQTCDELTQVVAEDDDAGDVEEAETYEVDVTDNDDIFCVPATFEVISFNADYLEDVSIDENGLLTFTVKEDVVAINGLAGIKYRVTCGNGQYDEADVYMNVQGTLEGCLAPSNIQFEFDGEFPSTVTVTWDAPSPAPAEGYVWELYHPDNLGAQIYTGGGMELSAEIPMEEQATNYLFQVRSNCGEGVFSNWIQQRIMSPVNGDTCGEYGVQWYTSSPNTSLTTLVSYIDCNSQPQTVLIYNLAPLVYICALQTGPNNPIQITGANNIQYQGTC